MADDENRILVVDDDADSAAMLCAILELDGYVASPAHTGLEALDLARRLSPLCVLMDIQMPGLNGHVLCERLRQEHGDSLILIAVTGAGDIEDRISDTFSKFDHYLRKPVEPERLRHLLPPLADCAQC